MKQITTIEIGKLIKRNRKIQHVTQMQLALVAGTGLRFISDLENGKPTCEIEKVLKVLQALNIELILKAPSGEKL